MGDTVRDIKFYIRDCRDSLLNCLISYYINGKSMETKEYWSRKVFYAFSDTSLVKWRNRYPTEKELMRWGFKTTLKEIQKHLPIYLMKTEMCKFTKILESIDIENLQNFMYGYVVWLIDELGNPKNRGYITIDKTKIILERLYKLYHN